MKTFARLIRRYVLATAAVVLVAAALCLGAVAYIGLHYGNAEQDRTGIETLAGALTQTAGGLQLDPARTPEEWLQGYAWAMVLDDNGEVLWQHNLPAELNKCYTASEIASFSRWYLEDWPVLCWTEEYGLLVAAAPKGTLWKYNICSSQAMMADLAAGILPALLLLLAAVLGCCLLFGWRGARQLQAIAAGLEAVAAGRTVCLPTDGFAGELADAVNRTSEQLRRRNEIIARRDDARTAWVAGVSHDVRTPLAMILGWAEQLEHDTALPDTARRRAAGIRAQSEKLRTLIEDLNLTSKLQYGAQPLRRKSLRAGPLFRALVAQFCENAQEKKCEIALEQSEQSEQAMLCADRALLERLLENLLNNSIRHNPGRVSITVRTEAAGGCFCLTVADDGCGYPPAVLAAMNAPEPCENAPHILGLHVVEQIAIAHGGKAEFAQNIPQGAKAVISLPME